MALLSLIEKVDNSPYTTDPAVFLFRAHDGTLLGKVVPSVAEHLRTVGWLTVQNQEVRINDSEQLDAKFANLTASWRQQKLFKVLEGWRSELYSCYLKGGQKYFSIERSAACLFGLVTYGCHITGYSGTPDKIWVPQRSFDKPTFPGMLDNTVAGGLGDNLGFWECAVKECYEEAGLAREYVERRLKPTGALTYEFIDPSTGYYQPEVECVYDLAMDPDTVPKPVDGEAQNFRLMSVDEVKVRMLKGQFKYNCALVLVDYFIRHGMIQVDDEPDYFEIVSRSHRNLEYPLRK